MDSSLHSLFLSHLFIFHFHTSTVLPLSQLSFTCYFNLNLRNCSRNQTLPIKFSNITPTAKLRQYTYCLHCHNLQYSILITASSNTFNHMAVIEANELSMLLKLKCILSHNNFSALSDV
jgi:hypothetical protein